MIDDTIILIRNTKWARSLVEHMMTADDLYKESASISGLLADAFRTNVLDMEDHAKVVTMPFAKGLSRGIKTTSVRSNGHIGQSSEYYGYVLTELPYGVSGRLHGMAINTVCAFPKVAIETKSHNAGGNEDMDELKQVGCPT
eukprot:scaffold5807_cov412-Prasinococcus_capsulatus_cf.AAC.4